MKCPACGSNNIYRDGTYSDGTQRYKCDTCSKVMQREGFMRDNQLKAQRLLQGPTEKVSWDSVSEYSAPISTTSYTSPSRERSKTKMPSFMQSSRMRSSGGDTNKIVMAHNLKFPTDITNQVLSILGIRGSGKSYSLGVYLEELNKVGTQFVLFDPVSAHSAIELPNLIHIAVKKGSTLKVKKLIDNLKHANNSYIIDLSRLKLKSQQKIINTYCEEMIDAKIGNRIKKVIVTAFEECQDFVPQRRKTECSANMIRFLKLGRQMGYGSVLLSQRATSIDKNALTQTAVYLIHQLSNYADIDNLKKQLGIAVDREGMKKIMRKIVKFEPGEVLCVSPRYISGVGALITKIRKRRTEHAGKNVIESQRKGPTSTSPTMSGFNRYMDQKDAGGNGGPETMASNAEDEFEMEDEDAEDMTDTKETIKTGNKKDTPSYTKPVMIMLCSVGILGIGWVAFSRYMNKQKNHIDREKDDRYERSLRLREREIRKKEKEKFEAELSKIEEEMKEKEKKKNAGSIFDIFMNMPGNEGASTTDPIPPGIEIGPDEAYGLREKYKRWFSQ